VLSALASSGGTWSAVVVVRSLALEVKVRYRRAVTNPGTDQPVGTLTYFDTASAGHVRIDGVSQVVLGESGLQVVFTHSQGFPEAPPLVPPR
jgi:hypothetical protein